MIKTLMRFSCVTAMACSMLVTTTGCDDGFGSFWPGKPRYPEDMPLRPDQVLSFDLLYQAQCAGCHGNQGKGGPAAALNDALTMSIMPEDYLLRVISEGVNPNNDPEIAKTLGIEEILMPASSRKLNGMLTDEQLMILAKTLKEGPPSWLHGDADSDTEKSEENASKEHSGWDTSHLPSPLPTYLISKAPKGSAQRGGELFRTYCSSCHGPEGGGIPNVAGGSVIEASYLALVSNQYLRWVIIAGRPEWGMPAYHELPEANGHALTDQQISDLVAYISSRREQWAEDPNPVNP